VSHREKQRGQENRLERPERGKEQAVEQASKKQLLADGGNQGQGEKLK
jgi:hypothetical protein